MVSLSTWPSCLGMMSPKPPSFLLYRMFTSPAFAIQPSGSGSVDQFSLVQFGHQVQLIRFFMELGMQMQVQNSSKTRQDSLSITGLLVPEGVEVVIHVLQLLQRLVHRQRRHLEHLGAHHLHPNRSETSHCLRAQFDLSACQEMDELASPW